MAERPSAVRVKVAWPYAACRCPQCVSRTLALGTVCPCKECQPGPGLDMHRVRIDRNRRTAEKVRRRNRLSELLGKDRLTDEEDAELVVLLDDLARPDSGWRAER